MKAMRATAWQHVNRVPGRRAASGYGRFLAMSFIITLAIYSLMYLGVLEAGHVEFSQTRFWRAIAMGAAAALVAFAFSLPLYRRRALNVAILVIAAATLIGASWLVRSQRTIDDVAYLKAMIPHQSVSLLTSGRARIHDERVRMLADEILDSRRREIVEMKHLIHELEQSPARGKTFHVVSQAAGSSDASRTRDR